MIGALTGTAIVDHFGRRKLLLTTSVICVATMAIISGLLANPAQNAMRANAGIVRRPLSSIAGLIAYSFRSVPWQAFIFLFMV
jgi:hypothetical protein